MSVSELCIDVVLPLRFTGVEPVMLGPLAKLDSISASKLNSIDSLGLLVTPGGAPPELVSAMSERPR